MSLYKKSNTDNIRWNNEIIAELKCQESFNHANNYAYRWIYDETKRNERIILLKNKLEETKDAIDHVNNYNNIYIPNYLKLVEPFKYLELFYIAV